MRKAKKQPLTQEVLDQVLSAIRTADTGGVNVFIIVDAEEEEKKKKKEKKEGLGFDVAVESVFGGGAAGGSGSPMLDAILQGPNTP